MAFLDGHIAQIVSRGYQLAGSGSLSVSLLGPEPVLALPLPQQDTWWGQAPLSPHSPVSHSFQGSPACSAGITLDSGSAASSPVHTAVHSPCSSPTISWAPVSSGTTPRWGDATPPAQHKPAAQRSLRAVLTSSSPAAAAADHEAASSGFSTPRANMIPAAREPPGAPRAPGPTARLLVPSDGLSRGRLQAWLNSMELKLAVPPGPAAPATDTCEAPKVGGAQAGCKPALSVAAGLAAGARLSHAACCDVSAARRAPSSSSGRLSDGGSSSCSMASSKKRALPVLDTLSLSSGGLPNMPANIGGTGSIAPAAGEAPGSARGSKRRSHDGAGSSGSGCAHAGDTTPGESCSACTVHTAVDLPAPAFDILGLLSGPAQQP